MFIKETNSVVLHNYVGTFGFFLFLFDTLFKFDILILIIHSSILYFGGEWELVFVI